MLEYVIIGGIIGACIGVLIVLIMIPIMKLRAKKVPRFSKVIPFSGDKTKLLREVTELLKTENYNPTNRKGEDLFQKGQGLLVAKMFIKILEVEEGILVEGFISIYGTYSGLDGITGVIPKKMCRKTVDKVIEFIKNYGNSYN